MLRIPLYSEEVSVREENKYLGNCKALCFTRKRVRYRYNLELLYSSITAVVLKKWFWKLNHLWLSKYMYKYAEYDYSFYEIYKTVNYVIKFFKFCELRSKWCILAGSSRTLSVCVCTYHQSIELLLDPFKLSYSVFNYILWQGYKIKTIFRNSLLWCSWGRWSWIEARDNYRQSNF